MSNLICPYIFDKIKPIIERKCNDIKLCESLSDEDHYTNNVRVENIMILKNSKMVSELIKQVLLNSDV